MGADAVHPTLDPTFIPVRPGILFATVANVLTLFFRCAPTVDDLRVRIPYAQDLSARFGGFVTLSIIEAGSSSALPGKESRAETERQLEMFGGKMLASATVIEGADLGRRLLRPTLRAIFMLRQTRFPHQFFEDADRALPWLLPQGAGRGDQPPSASELQTVLGTLRQNAGQP